MITLYYDFPYACKWYKMTQDQYTHIEFIQFHYKKPKISPCFKTASKGKHQLYMKILD